MGEMVEIKEILLVERLVEIVGLLDIVLDLRRQAARAVERPAGREPHHEEGERDDDEQRRDRAENAPDRVGEHVGLILPRSAEMTDTATPLGKLDERTRDVNPPWQPCPNLIHAKALMISQRLAGATLRESRV